MSLGETIYKLRIEKNLSQGDLSEMLGVSRQSISKWENNSAVPNLEKIIKLSEIFNVSLDELVKREETPRTKENVTLIPEVVQKELCFPPRKIVGTILLCMGFIVTMLLLVAGGGLAGLIFALPFLVCGIICFILKKNIGLWCAWAVYVLFDIYMYYATGISRANVLYTLQWTHHMNYMRLIFAWILVISLVIMILITVVRFSKYPFASDNKGRNQLLVAWVAVVILQVVAIIWGRSEIYKYIIENIFTMQAIYSIVSLVLSWSRIIAVTVAFVFTVRFIRNKTSNVKI